MYQLAALLAVSVTVPQSLSSQASPVPVSALTLDGLIEQLPRVGSECRWNEKTDRVDCKPAFEEFSRRLCSGVKLSDVQWQAALLKTGVFRARSKWPATRPFAVSMQMPGWLSVADITATPRERLLEPASARSMPSGGCGTYNNWIRQDALYQELGSLALGTHDITFDVTIDVHEDNGFRISSSKDRTGDLPAGLLWKGALAVHVEIVPTVDEAVSPVAGPDVDAAVRSAVGVAYSDWWFDGVERRTAILVIDPDTQKHPLLSGLALSLKISIEHRGVVAESEHLIVSNADSLAVSNSVAEGDERSIAFCASSSIPGTTEKGPAEREGWVLRLTGTSDRVEALWDASKRWSGVVEIPLDEAVRQDAARVGPKGRGPWVWIPR